MVFFSIPMIAIYPLTGYMCVHILNRDLQRREIDTIADSVFLKRHHNEQVMSFFSETREMFQGSKMCTT